MRNWSVDENYIKKFPKAYELWKLEQMISYGLDKGEKLDREQVKKHWSYLKNRLDPNRAKYIEFIM